MVVMFLDNQFLKLFFPSLVLSLSLSSCLFFLNFYTISHRQRNHQGMEMRSLRWSLSWWCSLSML
ncbi:hypothetical protein Golob_019316 [Gossypium lobatum]|uniref:Uncharacterized protein n=1 Tax=Gossypium lobatum TaxID=34289 RepID=A0A7J8L717_9ROSI|nr:hypothetical protein [Gossypium lobatum]